MSQQAEKQPRFSRRRLFYFAGEAVVFAAGLGAGVWADNQERQALKRAREEVIPEDMRDRVTPQVRREQAEKLNTFLESMPDEITSLSQLEDIGERAQSDELKGSAMYVEFFDEYYPVIQERADIYDGHAPFISGVANLTMAGSVAGGILTALWPEIPDIQPISRDYTSIANSNPIP